jgi:hypothetical protein
MTCEPGVDLGDDPRTARVTMPVPVVSQDIPVSKTDSYNMETDPLHIAYHIANGVSWSQLLAHGWTPKQMVTSGVSLQQLVRVYGWHELISWGFDVSNLANMGADPVTLRSIPTECVLDFRAKHVIKICPRIQDLLVTTWTPSIIHRMGFTWKQLKRMGIENVIHGEAFSTWEREFYNGNNTENSQSVEHESSNTHEVHRTVSTQHQTVRRLLKNGNYRL